MLWLAKTYYDFKDFLEMSVILQGELPWFLGHAPRFRSPQDWANMATDIDGVYSYADDGSSASERTSTSTNNSATISTT